MFKKFRDAVDCNTRDMEVIVYYVDGSVDRYRYLQTFDVRESLEAIDTLIEDGHFIWEDNMEYLEMRDRLSESQPESSDSGEYL